MALLALIVLLAGCASAPTETAVAGLAVDITSAGFSPSALSVKAGDTVTFTNSDSAAHWPASDVHPTHAAYPGSSASKCGKETTFDACAGLAQGESFSFVFAEKGTWSYHDHLNPGTKGIIVVE